MKLLFPPLVALALASVPAFSQTSSVDQTKIRGEVEALLQVRTQARVNSRNSAVQEILKRAQTPPSAGSFYEHAFEEVTFAGKPSGGQEKVDWARDNAELLQSPELRAAAQLNLRYLALTLQRSGSEKPLDFVVPSMDYVRAFGDVNTKLFSKQEGASDHQGRLLNEPIKDSLIVKANNLQALIKDFPDWEQSPGNLDGIFEKNIFSPLRTAKDARILDAWKLRLEIGDKAANAQKLDIKKQEFLQMQFPTWRFTRAEDLLILERKDEAISEMYAVLKQYPDHPSFERWGERLLQILGPAPATP